MLLSKHNESRYNYLRLCFDNNQNIGEKLNGIVHPDIGKSIPFPIIKVNSSWSTFGSKELWDFENEVLKTLE
jgi:hypothetical protein